MTFGWQISFVLFIMYYGTFIISNKMMMRRIIIIKSWLGSFLSGLTTMIWKEKLNLCNTTCVFPFFYIFRLFRPFPSISSISFSFLLFPLSTFLLPLAPHIFFSIILFSSLSFSSTLYLHFLTFSYFFDSLTAVMTRKIFLKFGKNTV